MPVNHSYHDFSIDLIHHNLTLNVLNWHQCTILIINIKIVINRYIGVKYNFIIGIIIFIEFSMFLWVYSKNLKQVDFIRVDIVVKFDNY